MIMAIIRRLVKNQQWKMIRAATGGFSLIELMVSTLILVIIFVGWIKICGFQAIRKESLRREGAEKAAGFLDVMVASDVSEGFYRIAFTTNQSYEISSSPARMVQPLFGESDPVGYVLEVERRLASHNWPEADWAIARLYDEHGVETNVAGRPFSVMSVYVE